MARVPEGQEAPSGVWMLAIAQGWAGVSGADVMVSGVGPPDPPGGGGFALDAALADACMPAGVAVLQLAAAAAPDLQGRQRHRCQPFDLPVRQFHPGRALAWFPCHSATLTAGPSVVPGVRFG